MAIFFVLFVGVGGLGLGALAGFLAGLFGIGGGLVLVPALYYAFEYFGQVGGYESDLSRIHLAIGTSLAVIIPTGFSSCRAHWQRRAIAFDMLARLAPGVIFGVATGVVLAGLMDAKAMKLFFAVTIAVLASYMVWYKNHDMSQKHPGHQNINWHRDWGVGCLIGAVSSLLGIGGATLSVPFMQSQRMEIQKAIGTASALGLVISCPAAIGFLVLGLLQRKASQESPLVEDHISLGPVPDMLADFSIGYVHWLVWLLIVPASMIAAPFGARYAHRLDPLILRRLFAGMMFAVALKMLWF